MIIAYTNNVQSTQESAVRVHGLVNRGEWFGKTWMVQIQMGYEPLNLVVEADHEADAIDILADSTRFRHLIDEDTPDPEHSSFAGNDGHAVNLDNVRIYKCRLDYFAPANFFDALEMQETQWAKINRYGS